MSLVDMEGEILVLPVVTVIAGQGLSAVNRIVGSIDVEDEFGRRRDARADKSRCGAAVSSE